jgi:hypothetical protein
MRAHGSVENVHRGNHTVCFEFLKIYIGLFHNPGRNFFAEDYIITELQAIELFEKIFHRPRLPQGK